MFAQLEQKIILSGLTKSTLYNYGRSIAQISLFFGVTPLDLSDQTINEYLGRYTHKTAISNYRILEVTESVVTFSYKDYRTGGKKKTMKLAVKEFIRRFALHFLPHGFARMRHYGILSSRGVAVHLPKIQANMNITLLPKDKKSIRGLALSRLKTDNICPCCQQKQLKEVLHFPRGEPLDEVKIWEFVQRL